MTISNKKKFLLRILTNPTFYPLIGHNLFPIFGVLYFGWHAEVIILLFIAETIIIGLVNVPKMLIARGEMTTNDNKSELPSFAGKLFMAGFFFVHYNIFNYAQITIIASNVIPKSFVNPSEGTIFSFFNFLFDSKEIIAALLIILGVHLFNFFNDFIIKEEYKTTSPLFLMFFPYLRIFVQQFVGIFGGMLILLLNLPIVMLILLQLLKLASELGTVYAMNSGPHKNKMKNFEEFLEKLQKEKEDK